ncbi:DUF2690 domain-containing protein [Sorangium sp. So ce375]|uniref:DUF2690 domain-containing protein n=1 Tax=Sorangium sp. So ce375 TaxID=3133306 RepID=UPI003F5B5D00
MRIVSSFAVVALGASSALAGCIADTSDPEPLDGEDAAQEGVGEARAELGSCYGASCTGQDPGATGCEGDAVTRASSDIVSGYSVIGRIVIRYSPSCNAAWARTVVTSGSSYLRAEITRSSPYATSQAESPSPTDALRSPMLAVTPGSRFTAVGKIGSYPGMFQFSGTVRANF